LNLNESNIILDTTHETPSTKDDTDIKHEYFRNIGLANTIKNDEQYHYSLSQKDISKIIKETLI